jgi:hypothetical protein
MGHELGVALLAETRGGGVAPEYDAGMWKRFGERATVVLVAVPMIAWGATALLLAVWPLELLGIEHGKRIALGLATVIFFLPVGAVVAFNEFVLRRIRYGPPSPGRHERGTLTSDEIRAIDQRLRFTGENEPET